MKTIDHSEFMKAEIKKIKRQRNRERLKIELVDALKMLLLVIILMLPAVWLFELL